MNPYIRAAQKFPALCQQAQERLSKRPGHAASPTIPDPKTPNPSARNANDPADKGKRGAVQ